MKHHFLISFIDGSYIKLSVQFELVHDAWVEMAYRYGNKAKEIKLLNKNGH